MPTSSPKTTEHRPEPKEDPKPAAKKKDEPNPRDLADELEALKAQGNKNPERLAELKKLLAESAA